MGKENKNYSIVIVSDALTASREFTLSQKIIKRTVLWFSFFVLIFGFIIFDYLHKYINISSTNHENIQLKKDVQLELKRIAEISELIKKSESRIVDMEKMSQKFMIIAGLNALEPLDVGRGGSTPSISIEKENDSAFEQPQSNAVPALDLNKISRVAVKTERDLEFVLSSIKKKRQYLDSMPTIWPCRGYISSGFGSRTDPFTGKRDFHNGLDISAPIGTEVIAPGEGYVLAAAKHGNIGKMIIIDHGYGYVTRYGHLADYNVKVGQRVKRHQVIGYVGSSGRSTAPHLHYEVRVSDKSYNPMNFILD